jgi:hypothetical protein
VAALEEGLRSGALKLETQDVHDSATRFFVTQTFARASPVTLKTEDSAAEGHRDPVVNAIADLRAGSRWQILRALPRDSDPDPVMVPFLIALLARDDVGPDVLRSLRRIAPRITGQLVDALLDPEQDPVIRRRIPRVLVAAPGPRAADGLLRGLEDPLFKVRHRCAVALANVTEVSAHIVLPHDVLLRAVARELQPSAGADAELDEDVLDLVFTLLSLAFEREPIQIAARALGTADRRLQGTALEYLETVLPQDLCRALFARLDVGARERTITRPAQELLAELLKSSHSRVHGRRATRAPHD